MELKYRTDTKHRKDWFTGVSFSHPAKMMLPLQLYLIENYTKPGDTILDPIAGSGTVLVACSMGRNVICVELEAKFIKIIEGNWQKIQQRGPQMGYTMGHATILQGDARRLDGVLADSIITSPAYGDVITGVSEDAAIKRKERLKKAGYNTDKLLTPGRYEHGNLGIIAQYNDKNPDNVQNLSYGSIDAVLTSPPYANRLADPAVNDGDPQRMSYRQALVDSVITSPPYSDTEARDRSQDEAYRDDREQTHAGGSVKIMQGYQGSHDNIGNLKSTSYLEAMLTVYENCYRVLKPSGVMVLVTKNFIRNKKIVRLDEDTIKLCEKAGFTFKERIERKLLQQSFWRTLYRQKYPDAPGVDTEDVLVFKRTGQ